MCLVSEAPLKGSIGPWLYAAAVVLQATQFQDGKIHGIFRYALQHLWSIATSLLSFFPGLQALIRPPCNSFSSAILSLSTPVRSLSRCLLPNILYNTRRTADRSCISAKEPPTASESQREDLRTLYMHTAYSVLTAQMYIIYSFSSLNSLFRASYAWLSQTDRNLFRVLPRDLGYEPRIQRCVARRHPCRCCFIVYNSKYYVYSYACIGITLLALCGQQFSFHGAQSANDTLATFGTYLTVSTHSSGKVRSGRLHKF